MPRRHRTRGTKQAAIEINSSREYQLFHGRPILSDPANSYRTIDEMRIAWQYHRKRLLAKWKESRPPGTRPFAMWVCEIVPEHGERPTTEYWTEASEQHRNDWLRFGILHTRTDPPIQQDEYEFLFDHAIIGQAEYDAAVQHQAEQDAMHVR